MNKTDYWQQGTVERYYYLKYSDSIFRTWGWQCLLLRRQPRTGITPTLPGWPAQAAGRQTPFTHGGPLAPSWMGFFSLLLSTQLGQAGLDGPQAHSHSQAPEEKRGDGGHWGQTSC